MGFAVVNIGGKIWRRVLGVAVFALAGCAATNKPINAPLGAGNNAPVVQVSSDELADDSLFIGLAFSGIIRVAVVFSGFVVAWFFITRIFFLVFGASGNVLRFALSVIVRIIAWFFVTRITIAWFFITGVFTFIFWTLGNIITVMRRTRSTAMRTTWPQPWEACKPRQGLV